MPPVEQERDLVLPFNAFAFVLDETKGNIESHVGPTKTSLAKESKPVVFDEKTKRFKPVATLDQAIQTFIIAPEGWYVTLKNPAKDAGHPESGSRNDRYDLDKGRKVNLSGPQAFALWPGQMARVVQGHHLRSNQYLLVRVYDEEAARKNISNAVVRVAEPVKSDESTPTPTLLTQESKQDIAAKNNLEMNLTMGGLSIIRGTEVSFYIPPTGIEVIPVNEVEMRDKGAKPVYVREAVTLERLEYAILLDESGEREYPHGPKVVFPRPTQKFITRFGEGKQHEKFRAVELNPQMGIYVKVNEEYSDTDEKEQKVTRKVGEELFITGETTKIYYPREEHSIVKYGDQSIHYAIAISKGEARYVLNKDTGDIRIVHGPKMLLVDPRTEVIVRRVLTPRQVRQWFPNNQEALAINEALANADIGSAGLISSNANPTNMVLKSGGSYRNSAFLASETRNASDELAMDAMSRKTKYTPPHTITLDSKYEGVVCINVWPGYAVQIVRRTGEREVVIGPKNILLEYDATLELLALSTGTPKHADDLLETVYLQYQHNLVSDVVEVITNDMVKCSIQVSYRVNFLESEAKKWFTVNNYVKLLCDHNRSLLASAAKQIKVDQLNADPTGFVRDTILGMKPSDDKNTKRPLQQFSENGMQVYDVEVLRVTIGDAQVARLLTDAQLAHVRQHIELVSAERDLDNTKKLETIKRSKEKEIRQTVAESMEAQEQQRIKEREYEKAAEEAHQALQDIYDSVEASKLARERERSNEEIRVLKERTDTLVKAFVDKMNAVGPSFISAVTTAEKLKFATIFSENIPKMPANLFGPTGFKAIEAMLEGTALGVAMKEASNGHAVTAGNEVLK